jgi:DNA-directed RNA polymerase I and III subunit RPAC2
LQVPYNHTTDSIIENTTAVEALEKGFNDLMDLCDVVVDKFVEARDAFEDQMKE